MYEQHEEGQHGLHLCPNATKQITWVRHDNYSIKSAGMPYTVAAWKTRDTISFRASKSGRFITDFLDTSDEAKQACEDDLMEQQLIEQQQQDEAAYD